MRPLSLAVAVAVGLALASMASAGRKALNAKPTASRAEWVTLFVHCGVMTVLGIGLF